MKQYSKFYSSLGLLILLNLIIKPVWIFFIDRQVQNTVGTTAYGTYFALFNFSIVLSFLLDWGFTGFFNRELAAKPGMIQHTGNLLFIKLLFAGVYIIIVCFFAQLSGIRNWEILWQVMMIQILISLFLFGRAIITAQQCFRTDAWLSVLDKSAMVIVCGSFIFLPAVFGEISITKFLWIQIACTFFAAGCAFLVLINKGIKFSWTRKVFIGPQMIKAAMPFGIIILLMSIHYRLDGFLLERIHKNGAYEAGLYAGAYRLLDAANMIGYLYASFLLPYIAQRGADNNETREAVLNGRHLLILFSIGVSLIAIFLAPWIQELLYHNREEGAIIIMQFCLPVIIAYSLIQVYGTVLTATGHVFLFCYIVGGSVAVNIILNLLLVPAWGAKGCCVAALVSQGGCGIATILAANKKCGMNIHARSLLMYIFIGILLAAFLYTCSRLVISNWLVIAGSVVITVLFAVITKLFDGNKWKKTLNQNHP